MRELKTKEIKRTGRIPKLPKAPSGEFDPRILESELQKSYWPIKEQKYREPEQYVTQSDKIEN